MAMACRRKQRMFDALLDKQRHLLLVFRAELVAQRKANAMTGALRDGDEGEPMPVREDGQAKA